jgi:hypothetical protein
MIVAPPRDVDSFLGGTFRRNAFPELVRAAEGVPRDAINIAALAAQHAHNEPIGLTDIRRAARDWYLRDKQTAINANQPAHQMRHRLRLLCRSAHGRQHSPGPRLWRVAEIAHRCPPDEFSPAREAVISSHSNSPDHPRNCRDALLPPALPTPLGGILAGQLTLPVILYH